MLEGAFDPPSAWGLAMKGIWGGSGEGLGVLPAGGLTALHPPRVCFH